ncbi:MAG: UDP-N-acetylmuramate--L-alanine ligase [Meiothermus sp.]|uniref:UDP-N-acetylmuramate--L-alanine ligase n=1 Tax=Meiothermus sp. TaxID=1955249 RepID=UPI0025D69026|nr:UDP-N-acetylmuramate--L-alanine ligase [Meiothermus sp.]MCS7068233.1 UDP-N-acetylmuramate--L-alanine ligase [Meiothermus sp.]MCX7601528.1 UDP-N-acetylmuramate--L-alanine ligase [Meiothermus sp.]MDW8425030.1 UDP-N-acetylmuramate--L-alanine ligase [Meiothermus sp.]
MKHYHLMGIGGISMSGLARILRKDGHRVSGCDSQLSDLTRSLEREGIQVSQGHSPAHLEGVDVLVASTAIKDSEPELAVAQTLGIPVWRRIQVVAEILKGGFSLGVTGSHGKTSTTSMLASIFIAAQSDPTVLLGAELGLIGGSAKVGSGRYRIAEVDESDPLFRFLELDVAVITNLEADHVSPDGQARPNYHASLEALQEAMQSFASRARHVIYNGEPRWRLLEELTQGCPRSSFGLSGGDCHAAHIQLEPFGSRFELVWQGQSLGPVRLQVPGEHNISNALAASAAALVAGVPFQAIQEGLFRYTGASRRFEKVGELNGALIVDDYAHNATKLQALLKAARNTGLRVRAVFQPHRFGRSEQEWPLYAEALELSDEALILDVYSAEESPLTLSSAQIAGRIVEHLQTRGHPARYDSWERILQHLRQTATQGDLILTIGAGSVSRLGRQLAAEQEAV